MWYRVVLERMVIRMAEHKKLSERQIQNRLQKHFDANYSKFGNAIQYYPDPQNNIWMYDVDELGKTITLTCDEYTGKVIETHKELIQEQNDEVNLEDYNAINPMKMGM